LVTDLITGGSILNHKNNVIHDEIYAASINLKGKSTEEARILLQEFYDNNILNKKIQLLHKELKYEIPLSAIQFQINIDKTVNEALELSHKRSIIKRIFNTISSDIKGQKVDLHIQYDMDILINNIKKFATQIENSNENIKIDLQNKQMTIINANDIKIVDIKLTINQISNILDNMNFDKVVEVHMNDNVNSVHKVINLLYERVCSEATNASYIVKDGKITYTEGNPGIKFDKNQLLELMKTNSSNVKIPLFISNPEITVESLSNKLFATVLSSYTSRYNEGNGNRSNNIKIATKKIDGFVISPGENFSFNNIIGPRTHDKGYKDAVIYANGRIAQGVGGGICQVSSTLYSAVLYTNFQIIERVSHYFPVSYVPLGQDATIAYGSIDFVFKNTYSVPIKIRASALNGQLCITILGSEIHKTDWKVVNQVSEHSNVIEVETYKVSKNANGTENKSAVFKSLYHKINNVSSTQNDNTVNNNSNNNLPVHDPIEINESDYDRLNIDSESISESKQTEPVVDQIIVPATEPVIESNIESSPRT